ncbi:hypothetical protein GCM10017559_29220 [Streptosporangium longisporum]|uniref:Uncharacterized protein n=1 Tax=Streptosporangium longisporum TaxID=46187 RepID=A0ABN3XXC4_9ACTN
MSATHLTRSQSTRRAGGGTGDRASCRDVLAPAVPRPATSQGAGARTGPVPGGVPASGRDPASGRGPTSGADPGGPTDTAGEGGSVGTPGEGGTDTLGEGGTDTAGSTDPTRVIGEAFPATAISATMGTVQTRMLPPESDAEVMIDPGRVPPRDHGRALHQDGTSAAVSPFRRATATPRPQVTRSRPRPAPGAPEGLRPGPPDGLRPGVLEGR